MVSVFFSGANGVCACGPILPAAAYYLKHDVVISSSTIATEFEMTYAYLEAGPELAHIAPDAQRAALLVFKTLHLRFYPVFFPEIASIAPDGQSAARLFFKNFTCNTPAFSYQNQPRSRRTVKVLHV